MAEVTSLHRGQMVSRRILTDGELPVMTAIAAIGDTGVIKHTCSKTTGNMTRGTIFRGRYMIRRFTSGRGIIVTGSAVIHDSSMIEHHCEKSAGHVTDTAILCGG